MSEPGMRSVLVIVPVFNEAAHLAQVLEPLRDEPWDVLVVDDGSSDESADLAEGLGFRVLRLPFNLGIGGAVQAGFQHAATRGYDVAVQYDGDGQHRVEHVGDLLAKMDEGFDVVIGSRFLARGGYTSTFPRTLGIKLFSWTCSRIVGTEITDCTSGFRALGRRAIEFCARYYPVDFPDMEALLLLSFHGCRIAEVSVDMNPRVSGRSSTNWVKSLYYPLSNVIAIYSALSKRDFVRSLGRRRTTA